MDATDVVDIGRDAIWVLLKISAPVMLASLFVGLIIALFQALTQIQEATLTFVPKVLAIFLTLILTLPWMISTIKDFNQELMNRIVNPEPPPEQDGP
ncbi:MAG: flagellar biosynthesis protein FliQ [Rickettsiales bacterium]|nr:flagellar biosynthesis protein FliQ [Rickettsiales bacterium]